MEGKGFLVFLVLAVLLISVFGYLGVKTYKDMQQPLPKEEPVATPQAPAPPVKKAAPDPLAGGREAYARGDYAAALQAFTKVQASDPNNAAAREAAAGAEAMLRLQAATVGKKWDEALAACVEAAKYSLSASDARRRMPDLEIRKSYQETYDKAAQTAEKGEYAAASQIYIDAWRIASRISMATDAREKAAEMQRRIVSAAAAEAGLKNVLLVCADRNDPYAMFAAATCFLSNKELASQHADLQSKLDVANATIAGMPEKYPSPRVTTRLRFDVVKLRSGSVERGQMVAKDAKTVKLRQEKDGKEVTRTFLAQDVEEVTEEVTSPQDANNKSAERLLDRIVRQIETKRLFDALSSLGILLREFHDVPLLKDDARQQKIIAAASAGTALKGAVNCRKLLEVCVAQCQAACPKCEGLGRLACANCKGEGKVEVPCAVCGGQGRTTCFTCNGAGKVMGVNPGTTARCQVCAGKGFFTCAECKGKKGQLQPCGNCQEGKTVPCELCVGTGRRR